MAYRIEDVVLRGRWYILAAVALVTALAAVAYSRLSVENNLEAWFAPGDPEFVRYREFRDRFETDETIFVVVHAPDVFAPEVIARIDRLSRTLEELPGVTRVQSLTNIEDITGTTEGLLIDPLVPADGRDSQAMAALRRRVLADPFFPGTIVSRDGRTTAIIVEVGHATAAGAAALVDATEAAIGANGTPDTTFHVAGWMVVNVLMDRLTQLDVRQGFPITIGVLALCLAVILRSVRAVLIINVAVVLAVLWTMGTFVLVGYQGTALTVSALPGIMLALTVAIAVHVVARFYEERVTAPDPMEAMRRALPALMVPTFVTCATTAAGLESLLVAYVLPVRHLGVFSGIGMLYTFIICVTVVPIMLVAFPPARRAHPNPRLERFLVAVADFNARHYRAIVAACAVLAVVALVGLTKLRPQGTNLHYLPDDSAPVRAMRFIEDHFGGASTLDVAVSGAPDVVKDPATARTVAAVQNLLKSYPETSATIAYTDLLKRMNRALHDGDPAYYRLPETARGIAQQLLLYETSGGADLPQLVDVNGYDIARVRGFTTSFMGMEENERLFNDLRVRLAALAPKDGPPLTLEITGDWPLWLRMNLSLLDTMEDSFLSSLIVIGVLMILLVRSVRLGLLALIPNVLPVLLSMGALGWMGVELDFATVMMAGIALGIAVDDTVHYLARYREELAVDDDAVSAMRRCHATVGKGNVTACLVLFLGMGSMVLSSFPPHRTFGLIIAITMVVAMVADLLLLPSLLHLTGLRPGTKTAEAS
jgi:predicted RND superfamily exporter protein